jgi:hypothetical protein
VANEPIIFVTMARKRHRAIRRNNAQRIPWHMLHRSHKQSHTAIMKFTTVAIAASVTNSLSTTHAWQYREVENDCAFVKRFAIDLLRVYKNKSNSQNSMMHVNQECRSLSSWKYRNYAKETMAIASKHQATMRMIHPATNLEMDTTEAPQQQQ